VKKRIEQVFVVLNPFWVCGHLLVVLNPFWVLWSLVTSARSFFWFVVIGWHRESLLAAQLTAETMYFVHCKSGMFLNFALSV
jgi:hypothetical protein